MHLRCTKTRSISSKTKHQFSSEVMLENLLKQVSCLRNQIGQITKTKKLNLITSKIQTKKIKNKSCCKFNDNDQKLQITKKKNVPININKKSNKKVTKSKSAQHKSSQRMRAVEKYQTKPTRLHKIAGKEQERLNATYNMETLPQIQVETLQQWNKSLLVRNRHLEMKLRRERNQKKKLQKTIEQIKTNAKISIQPQQYQEKVAKSELKRINKSKQSNHQRQNHFHKQQWKTPPKETYQKSKYVEVQPKKKKFSDSLESFGKVQKLPQTTQTTKKFQYLQGKEIFQKKEIFSKDDLTSFHRVTFNPLDSKTIRPTHLKQEFVDQIFRNCQSQTQSDRQKQPNTGRQTQEKQESLLIDCLTISNESSDSVLSLKKQIINQGSVLSPLNALKERKNYPQSRDNNSKLSVARTQRQCRIDPENQYSPQKGFCFGHLRFVKPHSCNKKQDKQNMSPCHSLSPRVMTPTKKQQFLTELHILQRQFETKTQQYREEEDAQRKVNIRKQMSELSHQIKMFKGRHYDSPSTKKKWML